MGEPDEYFPYVYPGSEWGDLLTSFDWIDFSCDGIGNTLFDGNWSYTWQHGRELTNITGPRGTWDFTYDANGMRTSRSEGSTVYKYVYNGSQLSRMTVGNNTLDFTYDANGTPLSFTQNGEVYYYVTNLQGDIVGILDDTRTLVVGYEYDAWGNILFVSGSLADTIGKLNPLRYRGYVYDEETWLYYLQSRYYNPEIGRFINADSLISTGQRLLGYNMFAYCNNNPVMYVDDYGNIPWLVLGIVVVCTAIGACLGYNSNKKLGVPADNINKNTTPTNALDMLPQNQNEDLLIIKPPELPQDEAIELTKKDRIQNAVIGGSLGLLVSSGAIIAAGVVGAAAVGSATVYISALGGTGAQTVAIGALIYDLFAMIIAPFLGAELEPIEWEP